MKLSLSSLPSGVKKYQLSLYGYDRDLCKPADIEHTYDKNREPTSKTASDKVNSFKPSQVGNPSLECFEDTLFVGHWSEMLGFD